MTEPPLNTTPVVEVQVLIAGDVGGTGISRFRFIRDDAGVPQPSDANAAGAAVKGLYTAIASVMPLTITAAVQSTCEMFDIGSGLVEGSLAMTTTPTAVTGTGSGGYAAGTGARVNWRTNTISGRRMLRGATYLVPMSSNAFTTTGGFVASTKTAVNSGAAAYIAAMVTAHLVPVVWHRPPAHTTTGGKTGPIVSGTIGNAASGLRSRRS